MSRYKQLYVDTPLLKGEIVAFEKDFSKRLSRVLRMKAGEKIAIFNGLDGLFLAEILDDKCLSAHVLDKLMDDDHQASQVTLIMACVKKNAFDLVFRQATEMGVTYIQPVLTDFTVVDKINEERVQALLVEAAEQCERLSVPVLLPLKKLSDVVTDFEQAGKRIFHAAEEMRGQWGDVQATSGDALLIGPEGGFSEKERQFLGGKSYVTPVGLGAHILRADTAAVAGLSRFFQSMGN